MVTLADERDCLDVAGAIAKAVEYYEGDDLIGQIVPHLQPVIGERLQLRDALDELVSAGSRLPTCGDSRTWPRANGIASQTFGS